MKRLHLVAAALLVALVAAGLAVAGANRNASIHLSGTFEVPVRDTNAQGQAIFHVARGGASIDYKLIASNIENVVAAHIHCGVPGVNGPVTVWLFPSTSPGGGPPGGGRTDGVLAQGTITADDVLPQSVSAACPSGVTSLADVIALLENGGAYVNVHTSDGDATPNEGPGDFPGGEIRGDA